MTETWRPIPGFPKYEVSDHGRVQHRVRKQPLKCSPCNKGYPQAVLYVGNYKNRTIKVHRAVALAFMGDRPVGYQINHKDGNKRNNHISNLEYTTAAENFHHAVRLGLIHLSRPAHNRGVGRKLNREIVADIRRRAAAGEVRKLLAAQYGVHVMTVGEIIRGEIWKHELAA